MSSWRRRALQTFPDLRREIEDPNTSIYMLFFELLPRCRDAHDAEDEAELTRIYAFAEWCFRQPTGELSNAVAVAFYEHLADSRTTLRAMPTWVKPDIFRGIYCLLEDRSESALLPEVRDEYERRR